MFICVNIPCYYRVKVTINKDGTVTITIEKT